MENGKISHSNYEPESASEQARRLSDAQREDYKTFDINKAVKQDVRAAVSLLSLILDNPQILDLVVNEIEKIRAKIIEQESMPKREDFHPEMQPSK